MEVALDLLTLPVRGLDEAGTGRRHIPQGRAHLGREPLVLERDHRVRGCGLGEIALVAQDRVVRYRGYRRTSVLDERDRASRVVLVQRGRRALGVDPAVV